MASKKYGTLYIGVTNDLIKRTEHHKDKSGSTFTKKYCVNKLVYFEVYEDISEAILREKQMKKWLRQWKINLIEKENPQWLDLYYELVL